MASPYTKGVYCSKILFKDYGSLSEVMRNQKYKRYIKEDEAKDLPSYEYMVDDKTELYKVEDIDLMK